MTEHKDGSTHISAEEKERTERLPDGAATARSAPSEGEDTASGGGADAAEGATPPKPDEVDPETGTGPDGMPVDNPSG